MRDGRLARRLSLARQFAVALALALPLSAAGSAQATPALKTGQGVPHRTGTITVTGRVLHLVGDCVIELFAEPPTSEMSHLRVGQRERWTRVASSTSSADDASMCTSRQRSCVSSRIPMASSICRFSQQRAVHSAPTGSQSVLPGEAMRSAQVQCLCGQLLRNKDFPPSRHGWQSRLARYLVSAAQHRS